MAPKSIRKGSLLLGCVLFGMYLNTAFANTDASNTTDEEWEKILEEAERERLKALLEELRRVAESSKKPTDYASR